MIIYLGRFKSFDTFFIFTRRDKCQYKRKVENKIEEDVGEGETIETVENHVPIYQGIHEDELDSRGGRGSFAIKKISNITGKAKSGCAELPRWDGVIYFMRKLHRACTILGRDDPSQLGSRKCDFNNVAN